MKKLIFMKYKRIKLMNDVDIYLFFQDFIINISKIELTNN